MAIMTTLAHCQMLVAEATWGGTFNLLVERCPECGLPAVEIVRRTCAALCWPFHPDDIFLDGRRIDLDPPAIDAPVILDGVVVVVQPAHRALPDPS